MASGQDKHNADEPTENGRKPGSSTRDRGGGGWTIIPVSLGLGLIACCVLIPQADENRRLAHQREQLRIDLEHLQTQARVNDEFVQRVGSDPTLAERLAQRQMKFVRKGSGVLELDGEPQQG